MRMKNICYLFTLLMSLCLPLLTQAATGSDTAWVQADSRTYTLTVASDYGNPNPALGTHTTYCWGSTLFGSVDAAVEDGGAMYVCIGWSGTGSVPLTGNTRSTPLITLTTPSSSLGWNWIVTNQNVEVIGTVRDAKTQSPIAEAEVMAGGVTAFTDTSGDYKLSNVSVVAGQTLTASKTNYLSTSESLLALPSQTQVVQDLLLYEDQGLPIVAQLESDYGSKAIFIEGISLENTFTATVDWNGYTPGSVSCSINGSEISSLSGAGPEYAFPINMNDSHFSPTFSQDANKMSILAQSANGDSSDIYTESIYIIPIPSTLSYLLANVPSGLEGHVGVDIKFPQPPIKYTIEPPLLGKFGMELQMNASFDYTIWDGDWEVALGVGAGGKQGKRGRRPNLPFLAQSPKWKLYVGNKEIGGSLSLVGKGTATVKDGITFDEVSGHGEISGRFEGTRFSLLDVVAFGSTGWLPAKAKDKLKGVSIIIWLQPGIAGDVFFSLASGNFEKFELGGSLGLEAAYEPDWGRFAVGGVPTVTFQYPGDFFKELNFKAYLEATVKAWFFKFGPFKYTFIDETYPKPVARAAFSRLTPSDSDRLGTLDRSYLANGGERFVVYDPAAQSRPAPGTMSPLDAFRAMGRGVSGGTAAKGAAGDVPFQANLSLIENVFPSSSPAIADRGQDLMLLYVKDNGGADLQYTDIGWTTFNGTDWSTPAPIVTDTRGEFNPQVRWDGNGDAIAVWERITDPNFTNVNLTALASEMEIVWSRWDHTSTTWSTPSPLTANSYLDYTPLLAGPMTNGNLLLTWTKNEASLLMGTGTVSTASDVMSAEWDATAQSWSTPQLFVSNLTYELSQTLDGISNQAVYAWTRDVDGNLEDSSDQQIFYRSWNNGQWGATVDFSAVGGDSRNVRAVVSDSGDVCLTWQQGGDLVMDQNFAGTPTLIRADSSSAGFSSYALTFGPSGNLVLLWQEMSEDGSDAHYRVYDPVSGEWSLDNRLFADSALERSFAPVWDNAGNLTVAYNDVQMSKTNKTVTLESGETVYVENVPAFGRVDLSVVKRALVKDLALSAGGFTVEGNNYLPGDYLTLSATLENSGDVSVQAPEVAFYEGDPDTGGVLITNLSVSGWLEGHTHAILTTQWVVPEPAIERTLYAVLDPASNVTEFAETNNALSVSIGGVDLEVKLVDYERYPDRTLRVIATVQNLGAPGATNTILSIYRPGETNTPAATVEVPALLPGRLAEVALDLPPTDIWLLGNYVLVIDEQDVSGDVDLYNNRVEFNPEFSNGPLWWGDREVLDPDLPANDYAVANQGQLKWVATKAYERLETQLPEGAGTNVTVMVNGLVNSNNYLTVNQGQLKVVAQPFYDRLWELGMTNGYPIGVITKYPWDSVTNAPSDYGAANVGQLKYLFSFEAR